MAQRLYECMFLLDSGRYAQDPSGTEEAVQELLDRCHAEVVAKAPWQEGKLAYEMDGHRKGLHYLVCFKMDGSEVQNLARVCKLSDLVIRHLIIEHEQKLFDLMTQQLSTGAHGDDGSNDQEDSRSANETATAES